MNAKVGACIIPGSIQSEAGWDRALSSLMQLEMPLHIAGGLTYMSFKGPFQPKLIHGSIIIYL